MELSIILGKLSDVGGDFEEFIGDQEREKKKGIFVIFLNGRIFF